MVRPAVCGIDASPDHGVSDPRRIPSERRLLRLVTGRARLSYRRAEEIFEESIRLLANPLASPDDFDELEGWTLHRLRHSALTHDAEDGTSTPMLLARSRHASVRSLERYARPGVDAVVSDPERSGLQDHRMALCGSIAACGASRPTERCDLVAAREVDIDAGQVHVPGVRRTPGTRR